MSLAFNLYDVSNLPDTALTPDMAVQILKDELKSTLGLESKDLASKLLSSH